MVIKNLIFNGADMGRDISGFNDFAQKKQVCCECDERGFCKKAASIAAGFLK